MSYSIAFTLHLLAAIVWVGGMFFAHMILRPSAAQLLEPPQRLPLWVAVFTRFFLWVWIAILLLLASGYWMIYDIFGGLFESKALYIQAMHILGWAMIAIFTYIFTIPFQKLKAAVAAGKLPLGGQQINTIRLLVTVNLILGLTTIIIASGGKYINL